MDWLAGNLEAIMGRACIEKDLEDNCSDGALAVSTKRIAEWTDQKERYITAVPGLSLFRREEPTEPVSGIGV